MRHGPLSRRFYMRRTHDGTLARGVVELHPKRPQTKTAMTETATNQTKTATVKVQSGHIPKRPTQKWPHQN